MNPPLGEQDFAIVFPAGTVVRDEFRGGITYVKGKVGDPEIRRNVVAARALAKPTLAGPPPGVEDGARNAAVEDPFKSRGRWSLSTWFALTAAIAACGVAAASVARRRPKAEAKP